MARVTIDNVAERAGVSIKTVSRVVNGEPNVRPATRDRVEQAIAALEYRPNPSARSLAGNRTYVLGLFYDNPSAHYVMDIQQGVLASCAKAGYDLLIHPCRHEDMATVAEIASLMRQHRMDGAILTPPLSDTLPVVEAIIDAGTPCVRIAPAEYKPLCPFVETNDQDAAFDMTARLLALGHTRIGFIAGHPDHRAVARRHEGYREALAAHGVPYQSTLVAQGFNSFESGRAAAAQLLSLSSTPTAIFASNDDMAAGVIMEAHQRGIIMPAQLSVAGFDDSPVAHQIYPSLTTVRQPTAAMAAQATRLLIQQIKGASPPALEPLKCELIERESTGSCCTSDVGRKGRMSDV